MKGFAYEKPPLTFIDHLKQRRRWVLGSIEVLKRSDNPIRFKAPLIYGLISWFSALPSFAAAILSLIRPTGGVIDYFGGLIAGFTWWSIISNYWVGLEIHEIYVEEKVKGKPTTDKAMQYFMRRVFSAAVPCEMDKNGRMLVPYELRQNAGIENDIVIVGLMDRLEIWDKKKWDEITDPDRVDADAFSQKLSEYGI